MSVKQILIWAIILRFLVMPFFFHPDLKDHHQRASYLYTQGVLNIYEFLRQDSYTKQHNLDFSYPPLTYFTLGFYQYLISPLLGNDFITWTRDYTDYRYNSPFIFRYLFSLKIIYLVFDLLTGFLIYKLLNKSSKQKSALALWFFNPINLYAIYAIGQFDIIPTFFSVLSYYLWSKKKILFSGLSLGIAVAFKTYPLLFLPFYLLAKNSIKDKFIFFVTSVGVYGLTILPFLNSKEFQNDVLFSNLSTRIFQLKLPVGDHHLSIFIFLYSLLIILYLFLRSKKPAFIFLSIVLSLVFSTTIFHPQWIIWLIPFLTLAYGNDYIGLKHIVIFSLFYFIYFIFFNDRFLTTGLLSPVSTLYLEIPSFINILSENYGNYINLITRSLVAISLALITIKLLRNKEIKK